MAVAEEHDLDFYALYTRSVLRSFLLFRIYYFDVVTFYKTYNEPHSVGLWNAFYVILYAIGNATKLMRYSTR